MADSKVPTQAEVNAMVNLKKVKPSGKTSKAKDMLRKLGRSLKGGSSKKKVETIAWLPQLPPEILLRIVSFLEVTSLASASMVSSEWQELANSDALWFKQYRRHFLIDASRPFNKINAEMMWKQHFANAITRLTRVTEEVIEDPEDGENFVTRGSVHMELGHWEAALADFNMAIEVCKANPGVNHNVDQGLFYARRASLHRLLRHKEDAYFDISTAIEIDPEIANYHRIRGDWWREDGFPERALHDYDSAIQQDGSIAALYFGRALILLDLKHFDYALKNLDFAIQLDPTNAEYYCTRGRVQSNLRNVDAALKDLECAVALNGSVSQYYHWRGRLYREKDQLDKALQDFEKAVQLSGDDIDYSWRAIAYAQLKCTGAALRDIDKAIDRSPANSFHHQYKGILNYGLGRYQHALDAFSKAIELLPNWASHYIWRAAVYVDMQEYKKCLSDLDKASTLDTGDGPLFWRGLLYLGLGQGKKGMYDLKAALAEAKKLNPAPDASAPSRILFWLSVSFDLLGEADEAKQYLSRVHIAASTESSKASKFTEPARAYILARDFDKAKDLYRSMFAGNYAVDTVKTEQSHLDLLCELYRAKGFEEIRDWFLAEKKKVYATPLMSDGSQGEMSPLARDLSASIRTSTTQLRRSQESTHARSSSF